VPAGLSDSPRAEFVRTALLSDTHWRWRRPCPAVRPHRRACAHAPGGQLVPALVESPSAPRLAAMCSVIGRRGKFIRGLSVRCRTGSCHTGRGIPRQFSISMASPGRPPMHSVGVYALRALRDDSASVDQMHAQCDCRWRPPGMTRLMPPPIDFRQSVVMRPSRPFQPSTRAAENGSSQGGLAGRTWAAKASLSSQRVRCPGML